MPVGLSRRRSIRELAILLALYTLPGGVTAIFGSAAPIRFTGAALGATAIFQIGFALLILHLLQFTGEDGDGDYGLARTAGVVRTGFTAVTLAGALLIVSVIVQLLFANLVPARWERATIPIAPPRGIPGSVPFILLMVTTGVTEELFFRSYLTTRLRRIGLAAPTAVAIGALLFAIGHLYQGIDTFLFSLIAGVLLGAAWLRVPDLLPFALGHCLYNATTLLISPA